MKNFLVAYFIVLITGCSPYHNLTAHYNAYFIAKERIKEIESSIFESQEWNYDKVLPIYAQFDSTKSASLETQIEDCIQKASLAIQRHPNSKWEDDSYILVGKSRHYSMKFPDAIETFKYVNTHSKDANARHYALTELIRTFTEFNEYNNAVAVTDYLAKEKLNKNNQKRLYINTAYLYQKKGDQNKMVGSLKKAEALLTSSDKARINFIIGQTFHELHLEGDAFKYYKNVLKNNPTYELEFYSKLYMAQVTELAEGNDLKKIQRYFKNLLKDSKNKKYQDKIYFELAGFELKNGNIDEAINNYKLSVKSSSGNDRQKANSYLSLGEIHYYTLKKFVLAKSYYDSTISIMPKDEQSFEEIKKRQKILANFVKQILIIQKNDSLLNLATLPKDSILSMLTKRLTQERELAAENKKIKRQASINRSRKISRDNGENLITIAPTGSNSINVLSKGFDEFVKKWGNRALEDNWRRKNKKMVNQVQQETIVSQDISESTGDQESEKPVEDGVQQMMSDLPYEEEKKLILLMEIENALYTLGNIYNLRLEEDENAAQSFEDLLIRFPETEYAPEVLYQLYLLYKETNLTKSIEKGNILKRLYPESVYAKLVGNPNYREESFATNEQLKRIYRKLYEMYKSGEYKDVLFAADSTLRQHPNNEFSDNIALLKTLTIGQLEVNHKYQFELGEFIENYPESELNTYANLLLAASENFQQKRYNSAKAKFIEDFNQKHLFLIVYDLKPELTESIPPLVDHFLSEKNLSTLKTGNLILNETKSMSLVNIFPGKGTAINFMKSFIDNIDLEDNFKGHRINIFVITEDNFDIFYKTKNISEYITFFDKHYQ